MLFWNALVRSIKFTTTPKSSASIAVIVQQVSSQHSLNPCALLALWRIYLRMAQKTIITKKLAIGKTSELQLESTKAQERAMSERIYNPITAMGFSAMFTFQLDNT